MRGAAQGPSQESVLVGTFVQYRCDHGRPQWQALDLTAYQGAIRQLLGQSLPITVNPAGPQAQEEPKIAMRVVVRNRSGPRSSELLPRASAALG